MVDCGVPRERPASSPAPSTSSQHFSSQVLVLREMRSASRYLRRRPDKGAVDAVAGPQRLHSSPPQHVRLAIITACKGAVGVAPNHRRRPGPCYRILVGVRLIPVCLGWPMRASLRTSEEFSSSPQSLRRLRPLHAADCIHVHTPCRHYGAWRRWSVSALSHCLAVTSPSSRDETPPAAVLQANAEHCTMSKSGMVFMLRALRHLSCLDRDGCCAA